MANSVVHFEIPADDVERAGDFYRQAFGWDVSAMPEMGYTILNTTPTNEQGMPSTPGAINGGMMKRGEMGYTAYFKDTEGNTLGVWQNA